jgi:hypothetical protein
MSLTATGWTVSVQKQWRAGPKRHVYASWTLPTAGTYTASGIDIPDKSAFGFRKGIDYVMISDEVAGRVNPIKYDEANRSIRIFVATATAGAHMTEVATTVSVGAGGTFIVYAEVVGG